LATFHDPPAVWQPFGAFSQLAWPGQGQLLFLKGQVALDTAGKIGGHGMQSGAVRCEFFQPPYPVTKTVEARCLYRPDVLIEITAVAEISRERFRPPQGLP